MAEIRRCTVRELDFEWACGRASTVACEAHPEMTFLFSKQSIWFVKEGARVQFIDLQNEFRKAKEQPKNESESTPNSAQH